MTINIRGHLASHIDTGDSPGLNFLIAIAFTKGRRNETGSAQRSRGGGRKLSVRKPRPCRGGGAWSGRVAALAIASSSVSALRRPHRAATRRVLLLSCATPRSRNSIPDPATRSFTVLDTSTSPGCASEATRPRCAPRCRPPRWARIHRCADRPECRSKARSPRRRLRRRSGSPAQDHRMRQRSRRRPYRVPSPGSGPAGDGSGCDESGAAKPVKSDTPRDRARAREEDGDKEPRRAPMPWLNQRCRGGRSVIDEEF